MQLVEPTYQHTLSPTGEFLCLQGNSFVYLTPEKNFHCKLPPKYKRRTCATIGTKLSVANDKKCMPDSSGRGGKGNRPHVLENGYLATKLTIIIVNIHHDKVVLVKEEVLPTDPTPQYVVHFYLYSCLHVL